MPCLPLLKILKMKHTVNHLAGTYTSLFRLRLKALILLMSILITHSATSQTWSPMAGGGMNDWVYATAIYNGDLIVAGKFTSAGGVAANHIARWDGTAWTPLGLGVNGKVNALAVFNGNLVAAGEFTMAGSLEVNFIAQWNGTDWDDQLGGVGSIVTSLAVIGTDLYVGGYFTDADGVPANYIAKRNSTGWSPLGSGMGGTQGQVMALTVHNGELYAGGFFTTAGGIPASHIAKWNGTTWAALGSGIGNIVYALSEYNGNLVAGGLFSTAGGVSANNIASWNGTSWSAFGSGMGGVFYQYVLALTVYHGNLIAGGYFTTSGGITTNGIARWDGAAWNDMGGGLLYPANVYGAHTFCLYGGDLIVGGLFSSAGSVAASHIARWNEPQTPVNRQIGNDTVAGGIIRCYDATQTITVAGSGTTFSVLAGGTATLIAGQNIVFLPGVTVEPGGYLLGTVSAGGPFCSPVALPAAMPATAQSELRPRETAVTAPLRVYPNPASEEIFIEHGNNLPSGTKFTVYNSTGRPIRSVAPAEGSVLSVRLDGFPAGVYFLKMEGPGMNKSAVFIRRK